MADAPTYEELTREIGERIVRAVMGEGGVSPEVAKRIADEIQAITAEYEYEVFDDSLDELIDQAVEDGYTIGLGASVRPHVVPAEKRIYIIARN